MKNKLSLFIVCFACVAKSSLYAQCMTVPVDLAKLCDASEQILEGRLSFVKTFIHTNNNVYSIYSLQVASVYKGFTTDSVFIVSLGGKLDLQITKAQPSDELRNGYGFFFLKRSRVMPSDIPLALQFELSATTQGRVWFENNKLQDVFGRYSDYAEFKARLSGITHTYINLKTLKPESSKAGAKRATPTITSFTPTSRTAGTDSIITITGTNFNSPQGTGFVAFRDADAGGASFLAPIASDYISWTNTQIVVKVPTSAGTGTIAVVNSDPASVVSSTSLTVPYNLINATFNNVHFGTRLQGLNTGAKMLFTFNTRFNDSTRAKQDFVQSMDNWRCKSFINWDTATSTTGANTAASNGTHLVTWDFNDTLTLGVLGVAISNFSGCIQSGDTFFYVSDLDMLFNDQPYTAYTWEYGPGIPSASQFDFESVATHELGHGHQLGHVIDANKVMHYSISPNERKNVISTQDSFGAVNIMAKNVVSVCGQTAMTPLTSTNCSFVALPVDWVDIQGLNRFGKIQLNWKVYNEYEVERYKLTRSFDGIHFEDVGSVHSQSGRNNGYFFQVLSYEYADHDVQAVSKGAYYRVFSMDYDGKEQASNLIYVPASGKEYFYTKREGNLTVLSSSADFEKADIKVINALGQQMHIAKSGNDMVLQGVSTGVYYVIYHHAGQYHTQKITIFE
jgi:hypothetical protein